MQPQNPKKDHHILPRLYLRGFAISREKPFVYIYEKGVKTEPKVPKPISKASVIPYAYSYTRRDGTFDPDTYENELEKLEKPSDPIFHKIRNGTTLDEAEKKIFASYVLLMRKRVPEREELARKNWEHTLATSPTIKMARSPEFLGRLSDQKRRDVEDLIASYESGPPKEILLKTMVLEWEEAVRYLRSMRWRFLVARGPSKYFTGDNPVFYTGLGLMKLPAELTLPISTDITLHASWQEGPEGFFQIPEKYVRQLNHRTAGQSDTLFHHRAERWVAQILHKENHPSYLLDVSGTLQLLWRHKHLDIPEEWLDA